mmetsp:Transcript_25478/g.46026  ORF Transcript_25478/g.46026 Transcript_25478/m.46026 type:complete len:154 (+) Transcript_25478:98-559(+)
MHPDRGRVAASPKLNIIYNELYHGQLRIDSYLNTKSAIHPTSYSTKNQFYKGMSKHHITPDMICHSRPIYSPFKISSITSGRSVNLETLLSTIISAASFIAFLLEISSSDAVFQEGITAPPPQKNLILAVCSYSLSKSSKIVLAPHDALPPTS